MRGRNAKGQGNTYLFKIVGPLCREACAVHELEIMKKKRKTRDRIGMSSVPSLVYDGKVNMDVLEKSYVNVQDLPLIYRKPGKEFRGYKKVGIRLL